MFYRRILTLSLFILEIIIVRTIEAKSLSTAGFPSAAGDVDEDDEYNLVVRRGNDVLTSTQTQTGHHREITLTLTAFSETFVLDLKLNTYLFASTYIEKAVSNSGEIYNEVNHMASHCYYTGQVRNRSQSTAAVSTCKGITGYFTIGNVSYHIEPKGDDLYGRHRVFRNRDDVKTNFGCGTHHKLKWKSNINSMSSFGRSLHRIKRSFNYPQDKDRADKVIEVYVANDHSQYLARSSNVQNVYRRTKDIVNIASSAYQPLGIYLVLVGVEVWTDSNRFTIRDTDVSEALSNWYTYRQNSVNPFHYNDNGVLITNVAFYGAIVGKAVLGTMCSNQNSGAIISDLSSLPAATGAIFAHEMGHSFGLQHDDAIPQCSCDDSYANNHCIMYSYTDPQRLSTKWSTCSRNQFDTAFSQGLDICLYNIPQTIFQPSSTTCGNGIVEEGEQCDCGNAPDSECNTTCCNSTTCQLTDSAAFCASGRCCDTSRCQIKSSGTECRSKSNDCDLPESCNGVDAQCPTDSYKPDGTDCTNIEAAYCYKGQCRSHRSQCELIWGPGTLVANDLCYKQFNTAGKFYGNCGLKWKDKGVDYIACAAKNVMCGMLQCQNVSQSLYYYQRYYSMASTSIGPYSCHFVIFDFGIGTLDPGLVPNGAKCGDRQMCVNQKCVNIADSSDLVMLTPASTSLSTSSPSSPTATTTPTTTTTSATITMKSTTINTSATPTKTMIPVTTSMSYPTRSMPTPNASINTSMPTTTFSNTNTPKLKTTASVSTTTALKPTTQIPNASTPISAASTPIFDSSTSTPNTSTPILNGSTRILNTSTRTLDTSTPTPTLNAIAPISTTSTPIINASTPISNTSTPIFNASTPILIASTSFSSTSTSEATKTQAPTTTVVLGVVLGALALVTAGVLPPFCCYMLCPVAFTYCCQLFISTGPTTTRFAVELVTTPVFTRWAFSPMQYRKRWIPVERYYLPPRDIKTPVRPQTENLQPDWRMLRTIQPLETGYQYTSEFYPYSFRDNTTIPQIVIR